MRSLKSGGNRLGLQIYCQIAFEQKIEYGLLRAYVLASSLPIKANTRHISNTASSSWYWAHSWRSANSMTLQRPVIEIITNGSIEKKNTLHRFFPLLQG